MDDPFGSIVPLCEISPSQELELAPFAAHEDSRESKTSGSLGVAPTGICMVSPPESPEANDGTLSQDNFETPPEEAVPAASSEERWFGCDGDSVVVGAGCAEDEKMEDLVREEDLGFSETGMTPEPVADSKSGGALAENENEKTVDLRGDTDLGFSETGMAHKPVSDSESGGAHVGRKLVNVEISESELTEFMNWKRKLAFRKRLLEERRQKRSKLGSPRPGAGAGVQMVEDKSIDNMNSTMGYLKSTNSIPGLESPESLRVEDQKLIKSREYTLVLSLDSEGNSLVSDAGMVKNGLDSNECTQVVRSFSGGKGLVADGGMSKNGLGSNDCTEVANLGRVEKGLVADSGVSNNIGLDLKDSTEVVAKKGVESNDCTEVVGLDSGGKGLAADAGVVKDGIEMNDCTQVARLDSGSKGRVSGQGIATNGLEFNDVVMLDFKHSDLFLGEGIAKNCTEVVGLDSGARGLPEDAEMARDGVEMNGCTRVVRLDSGSKVPVLDQSIAKNGLESNDVVMLDSKHNDMVLGEGTVKKHGLASTEEIIMDSDGDDLGRNEAFVKIDLASNESTEDMEGEGLVLGAGVAKKRPTMKDGAEEEVKIPALNDDGVEEGVKRPTLKDGAEEGVKRPALNDDGVEEGVKRPTLNDGVEEGVQRPPLNDGAEEGVKSDPSAGKAEKLQSIGERMCSDSRQRPKAARVLPMAMNVAAKEGDSTKNPLTDLLLSALSKLPKTQPDPRFENLSLVEIAKLRSVTFPRPSWWGEEEEE